MPLPIQTGGTAAGRSYIPMLVSSYNPNLRECEEFQQKCYL